jgi:hypothetical protein
VTVDGSRLKEGDFAGLCALQGDYGFIALTKKDGVPYLAVAEKKKTDRPGGMGSVDSEPGEIKEMLPVANTKVRLRIVFDFSLGKDTAQFYYETEEGFVILGDTKQLYFRLDHFVGCRFGLFLFSTEQTGGVAAFSNFQYEIQQ